MFDVQIEETARMFVLLDEWARLFVRVEDDGLSKEEAYDEFNMFARQFGVEIFLLVLTSGPEMNQAIERLKKQYNGTV